MVLVLVLVLGRVLDEDLALETTVARVPTRAAEIKLVRA